MSCEELENEIIHLKSINSAQSQKIDNYEQKLYELKRQLSTTKAMEEHLSTEIELLQKNEESINTKLLKKIVVLEEEIHTLKQTNLENVQYYETELQNKNTEIENIQKYKSDVHAAIDKDEINKYADEICELKLKIEEMTQQILDTELKYKESLGKNNLFQIQITDLNNEIAELKDCLQAKREELDESKQLVQNLQDDVINMQTKINHLQDLPMEKATKGNSLFAEVNDNRVKLQKALEIMRKKNVELRNQYSRKCQELQKVHLEYAALLKVMENKNDSSDENFELKQTYERHFERLTEQQKFLENELEIQKNAFTKLISKDWKCAQEMIAVTRDEVQTLQKKLNMESYSLLASESNNYKLKRELKKWQVDAAQLRSQIISLNHTIEELKVTNSPVTAKIIENTNESLPKKNSMQNYIPLFTKIEDRDLLDEKCPDDSIFNFQLSNTETKFEITQNDTKNIIDQPCEKMLKQDESKLSNHNLDERDNKENQCNGNICTSVLNNTVDNLVTKMKKVSFEENVNFESAKMRVRKIINVKPVHISSIKRN